MGIQKSILNSGTQRASRAHYNSGNQRLEDSRGFRDPWGFRGSWGGFRGPLEFWDKWGLRAPMAFRSPSAFRDPPRFRGPRG